MDDKEKKDGKKEKGKKVGPDKQPEPYGKKQRQKGQDRGIEPVAFITAHILYRHEDKQKRGHYQQHLKESDAPHAPGRVKKIEDKVRKPFSVELGLPVEGIGKLVNGVRLSGAEYGLAKFEVPPEIVISYFGGRDQDHEQREAAKNDIIS